MPDVEITKQVSLNLNGFDREATVLEPGTHTVPEHAATWIRRNPSFGHVLGLAAAAAEVEEADEPDGPDVNDADEVGEASGELVDLATLSTGELRRLAAEGGVEGRSGMNKDQLVEALTALADQPEAEE